MTPAPSMLAIALTETHLGNLRSVALDGEPWFVAVDVCKALGIKNSRSALIKVDSTDKNTAKVTEGRGRPVAVINESGLYALVLQSRKPTAKAFRRLITTEVIPSLVRHGVYVAGQGAMTDCELQSALQSRGELLVNRTREQRRIAYQQEIARIEALFGRRATRWERFVADKP